MRTRTPVLKWVKVIDLLPKSGKRVLIFSPCYNKDNPMRIRIVDADFVKICTDATHWAYIPEPESENVL